jgi:hypothetical protein
VAVRLNPDATSHSLSHILFDVTTIPMPTPASQDSLLRDPYLTHVTEHHEFYENLKFTGRRRSDIPTGAATDAILRQHYSLIPITLDPCGQLGPLTSHFLWDRGRCPSTALPLRSNSRSTRGLSTPPATQAANLALGLTSLSLFRQADSHFRESSPHEWYTRHWSATTPSQWAIQLIAFNITHALASHAALAVSDLNPMTSTPRNTFHVAQYQPRTLHPRPFVPSIYDANRKILGIMA